MTKIFIDGSAGTTGLRIADRLEKRQDISLIKLPEALRKDNGARKQALNEADIVFLCLPDEAAKQAVSFVENKNTVIIDTSTAHRTNSDWSYGFAELTGKRKEIASSKRIANPGCHASGFIALVAPLVEAGFLRKDQQLSAFSLTGYSGGGKKMIAEYEADNVSALLKAPRQYALSQQHKHLAEMKAISGIDTEPIFSPIVANFYSGMQLSVPIFASCIKGNISDICDIYKSYYNGKIVCFCEDGAIDGFLSAAALSGSDGMQISVYGNEERILLTALYDNLGKGASGAAIQNMNIVMGVDETTGLVI